MIFKEFDEAKSLEQQQKEAEDLRKQIRLITKHVEGLKKQTKLANECTEESKYFHSFLSTYKAHSKFFFL